jgi:pristinamycin I synthase-3/4
MTLYYAPTPRQVQDWRINAHLPADQPPSTMKLELLIPADISLEGIEKAYRILIGRHAILRTCFPVIDGRIVQEVIDYHPNTFELLRLSPDDKRLTHRYNHALAEMKDVTRAPLIRSAVWYGESGSVFMLLIQHMACDAWSMKILRSEMERLCILPDSLPELNDHQLNDYFDRNKSRIDATQSENLSYWLHELADKAWLVDFNRIYLNCLGPETGALKVRKFRNWEKLSQENLFKNPKGYFYSVFMANSLFAKLAEFSAYSRVSVYSILLSCWGVLGMESTGNRNMLIRSIYNNRTDREVRDIVGNFLEDTFMYLRIDKKSTFEEFSTYCYRSTFQSMNRALYNCEKLEELQVMTRCFMLFNFLSKEMKGKAGKAEIREPQTRESNQIWSPLFCDAEEFSNTISFNCGYHASYLDTDVIKVMFERYFHVLRIALDYPHVKIQDIAQCLQEI